MEQILKNKTVAVLLADGFNETHLTEIKPLLENAGATLVLISATMGTSLKSREEDGADEFFVDQPISNACADEYAALLLPGGRENVQTLLSHDEAKQFVHDMMAQKSPVAALGEAGGLLQSVSGAETQTFTAEAEGIGATKEAGQEILRLFSAEPMSEMQKHGA